MSKNLKALQQALNTSTQRPAPKRATVAPRPAEPPAKAANIDHAPAAAAVAAAPVTVTTPTSAPTSYVAPSREGKVNITAYLVPDYKASLRLIQARTGKSLQTLISEALNDLFTKYDVPTVRGD